MTRNQSTNSGEIIIYGDISDMSWWGDEITPKQFSEDLTALGDVSEIQVRINSNGGDVFAGMAIHSMLRRHSATVTVMVDGLAASIASIIAMSGDKVIMPKGTMMMIHNPWSSVWGGDAATFRETADLLDKIRDSLVDVYHAKSGLDVEEIKSLMDSETWLSADEAVSKGFADEVEGAIPVVANAASRMAFFNGISFDMSPYRNAPVLPEKPSSPEVPAAPKNEGAKKPMTLEELKNQHPELYATAVADGVGQERSRMQALDGLVRPGAEVIINKARYETGASAAETALEILATDKRTRAKHLTDLRNDVADSGLEEVAPATPTTKPSVAEEEFAAVDAMAKHMNKIRGGK